MDQAIIPLLLCFMGGVPRDTPHVLQAAFSIPFFAPQFAQVHRVVVPQPQEGQLIAPIGKLLPQSGQRRGGGGGGGGGGGVIEVLLFPHTLHTMVSLIVSQSGQVQVAVGVDGIIGGCFNSGDIFSGISFPP